MHLVVAKPVCCAAEQVELQLMPASPARELLRVVRRPAPAAGTPGPAVAAAGAAGVAAAVLVQQKEWTAAPVVLQALLPVPA